MRTLKRNKQKIWYSLYQGNQEVIDSDGNYTGERAKTYSTPVSMKVNLSPATGNTQIEGFGVNADYSHVIVTDEMDCPIDEKALIWIGDTLAEAQQHTYMVARIARSLNNLRIAIRETDYDVA